MEVTGVMNRRKKKEIPSIGIVGASVGSTCVVEPELRKSEKVVNKPSFMKLSKKVMETCKEKVKKLVKGSCTLRKDLAHNLLSNVVSCKERDNGLTTTLVGIKARGTQQLNESTKYGRTRARRFGISMERAGACWAQGAWVRFSLWGTCW